MAEPRVGETTGLVPVPDPTTLTNERITLSVDAAVGRIVARMDGSDRVIDQRFLALTEALSVFKTSVNERFQLGDVQTEKAARDVKSAVDAAFAAAKEAVGEQNKSNALSIAKSEVATTKQIDQLGENLRISVKNTDDKFTDLKDRLVAIESRTLGSMQQRTETNAWVWPFITVLVAIVSVGFVVLEHAH